MYWGHLVIFSNPFRDTGVSRKGLSPKLPGVSPKLPQRKPLGAVSSRDLSPFSPDTDAVDTEDINVCGNDNKHSRPLAAKPLFSSDAWQQVVSVLMRGRHKGGFRSSRKRGLSVCCGLFVYLGLFGDFWSSGVLWQSFCLWLNYYERVTNCVVFRVKEAEFRVCNSLVIWWVVLSKNNNFLNAGFLKKFTLEIYNVFLLATVSVSIPNEKLHYV